jgi:predicted MFS family arabinose efflux permease
VGFGVGCAYVPVVGVVQKWFRRRRGTASGLAVSGIGVGTLAMPPLAAVLIEWMSWRGAYIALGLASAAVGIALATIIVASPEERGLQVDGDSPTVSTLPDRPATTIGVGEAFRSKAFVGLYAACFLCGLGVFIPFVHLVPDALDRGVEKTDAAFLISVIGAGSTAGRFLLGGLADRLGRDQFLTCMYFGMGAAMIFWAAVSGFVGLYLFALAFGAFYGGWVAILPTVVMDRFGGANVSGIIGVLYTSVALGTLVGPVAAGYVHDATGSYFPIIIACACTNLAAVAVTHLAQGNKTHEAATR